MRVRPLIPLLPRPRRASSLDAPVPAQARRLQALSTGGRARPAVPVRKPRLRHHLRPADLRKDRPQS